MTEQPRLTPEAIAALEAAWKKPQAPEDFGKLAAPATQTEYERGWNDCYAHVVELISNARRRTNR